MKTTGSTLRLSKRLTKGLVTSTCEAIKQIARTRRIDLIYLEQEHLPENGVITA